MTRFTVNGKSVEFDGLQDTPLLWVLRDELGLTGTKYGCGIGQCGACTVHVDGVARRSCTMPVTAVANQAVTTIEALPEDGSHPVQKAWMKHDVPQCGYCQAGQIMATLDLLKRHPDPDDDTIDAQMTNLCRCGTYVRVRAAIHDAARMMREGSSDA